ncbi:MAG: patatin-like phospholipase family protein [Acidimicrobiales bacterium]
MADGDGTLDETVPQGTVRARLTAPGPKRILALDGGGIRGTLTIAYLERLEEVLRERHGRPDLVLSDYFDLIGGTSTGSILAAGLATGREVAEVRDIYFELGPAVFGRRAGLRDLLAARYSEEVLERELAVGFGDIRLGDPEVRTGLCIVAKRADTWSVWPLHNHPDGVYGNENAQVRLRDATRASTAAPTFFRPVGIELADGENAAFIDGAVSTAVNPSLQLLLVATAAGYGFRWPTGADQLLLVSVGTGAWEVNRTPEQVLSSKMWSWAGEVPAMLMNDSNDLNQLLMQFLATAPNARTIDSEIGDLGGEYLGGTPLLTYLRYDLALETGEIEALGRHDLAGIVKQLREMDRGDNARPLYEIGRLAADRDVIDAHLPTGFDLPAN